MTLGNFTDAFQRRDLSKMSIGFLQEVGTVSKQLLIKHLVHRTGHAKSTAIKAIREHGRYLEREFWDMCFESLKHYAETGVQMYILGKGIRTVYPVLAYCVGDDPALHRYTGVYECNATYTCILCNYSVAKDGIYRPELQVRRDPAVVQEATILAIAGYRKKNTRTPLLQVERDAMKLLDATSLHYIPNATFGVPMGHFAVGQPNHIFRCPNDILHTFMCGLCKNVVMWIITIVIAVSRSREFEFCQGIFDSRIASFKDLAKLPNITTSYFPKGVCYLSENKTTKDKERATGTAAGFRSCEFVPLMIMMYFAIGVKGDVLPNTQHFQFKNNIRVNTNITQVALTAISTVLDCYFAVRTSPLTQERIDIIQAKNMDMARHFIALNQMKQYALGVEDPPLPVSRYV